MFHYDNYTHPIKNNCVSLQRFLEVFKPDLHNLCSLERHCLQEEINGIVAKHGPGTGRFKRLPSGRRRQRAQLEVYIPSNGVGGTADGV